MSFSASLKRGKKLSEVRLRLYFGILFLYSTLADI